MSKLTKDQAFDGLKKLHALTKDTSSMTRRELQDACGLRLTDMLVLTENEILECTSRRPSCWEWKKDVVPNLEMADKMLKTKVKLWAKHNDAKKVAQSKEEELPVTPGPTLTRKARTPGVKVFKKFEITKKYGEQTFTMTLEESGGGWRHALEDGIATGPCSADRLKAIGFALVTAAEIIEKESAE